jgi:ATP-binding cassette subfamily F protein 2
LIGVLGLDVEIDNTTAILNDVEIENAKARTCTGVLTSRAQSGSIKVEQMTVTFHGRELVTDTTLEVNMGRRYGLIGLNGCGLSIIDMNNL